MAQRLAASRALRALASQPLTVSHVHAQLHPDACLARQGLSWLGRWSGASGQRTAGFHGAAAALATIEVKIPALGESITDGTVAALLKQAGEQVGEDEPLVTVDTDKVSVDVRAPSAGVVVKMLVREREQCYVCTVV